MLTVLAYQDQMSGEGFGAMIAAFLFIVFVGLAIGLAVGIVICFLLYGAQQRVPPAHRKIEPGMIWLLLIPLFHLVWNFFVFLRVPESYQSYFNAQGRTDVGDCGRTIGLWYSICAIGCYIPCVNYLAGPATLVLLIIFLVKILTLKGQIPEGGHAGQPPVAMR